LFTAAVAGATKAVSDNVIQPGVEKVTDPNFQANVRGYMTEAQKKAASVGTAANGWSKTQFGVDVADTLGGAVSAVREKDAGPSRSGYGQLALTSPNEYGETSGLYSPDDTDDFFSEFDPKAKSPHESSLMPSTTGIATTTGSLTQQAKQVNKKKEDDWDDWKDF
jgi:ADP-ribosylation factor GTPase-activating protein 1